MSLSTMVLLGDVLMCNSQQAQLTDDRRLSMLGSEISCSTTCFVGLKDPDQLRERKTEKVKKEDVEILSGRKEWQDRKQRNNWCLSPLRLSPLVRYQPSGRSITLHPIYLNTLSFCPKFRFSLESFISVMFYCSAFDSIIIIIRHTASIQRACKHGLLQGDLQAAQHIHMYALWSRARICQSTICQGPWTDTDAVSPPFPKQPGQKQTWEWVWSIIISPWQQQTWMMFIDGPYAIVVLWSYLSCLS